MKNTSKIRLHIVSSYLTLLSNGISTKVSIQDICHHAFVSRRTFYNYFTSIDQLADFACMFLISKPPISSNDFTELVDKLFDNRLCIIKLIEANYFRNIHNHLTIAIEHTINSSVQNSTIVASAVAYVLLDYLYDSKKMYSKQDIISLYHTFCINFSNPC